jgi:hypothetical protein
VSFDHDVRGDDSYQYGFVYWNNFTRAAFTYDPAEGLPDVLFDVTGGWDEIPANRREEAKSYIRTEMERRFAVQG